MCTLVGGGGGGQKKYSNTLNMHSSSAVIMLPLILIKKKKCPQACSTKCTHFQRIACEFLSILVLNCIALLRTWTVLCLHGVICWWPSCQFMLDVCVSRPPVHWQPACSPPGSPAAEQRAACLWQRARQQRRLQTGGGSVLSFMFWCLYCWIKNNKNSALIWRSCCCCLLHNLF